ncbi:hypothetical protein C8Q75DRAFT_777874 [Abortiporus biennis]|nr:hypothetical protein C8Q75DRAFT_777874 [Abortiporus biennis]
MEDSDSPLESPSSPPTAPSQRSRRSTDTAKRPHRSKDRERSLFRPSSKDLAKLFVYEEKEFRDLRDTVYTLSEQLKSETQRADDAEKKVKEAVLRFKDANNARLAAQQDSARLTEELRLYKIQLDKAQKEILKAQELLDAVEAQRCEAEEAAARARSTARKLKEEKIMALAREEGRREGIEEGIARGRSLGFEEGRAAGYERGRAEASLDYPDDIQEVVIPIMRRSSRNSLRNEKPHKESLTRTSTTTTTTTSTSRNSAYADIPAKPSTPPQQIPEPPTPVPVYIAHQSPPHVISDFPPDGWIPKLDDDQRIRLPPPHELAPAPAPPTPSPPATAALLRTVPEEKEDPILMIPPPFQNQNQPDTGSDSDTSTTNNTPHRRARHRRRRSLESSSTDMSQFEILGPPVAASAVDRHNVLSAIAEERERSSSVSSPQNGTNSPYMSSPSFIMPLARPETQTPPAEPELLPEDRGRGRVSSPCKSPKTRSLSRSGSTSSSYHITVEPPSRPDSNQSSHSAPRSPGLLSANLADMPLPQSEPQSTPQTQPVMPPLSSLSQPISLPDGQLPPGFVPMGPPTPTSQPVIPPYMTPSRVPLPPSTVPSMRRLYTGTPSVVTSVIPGSTDPVVIPLPPSTVGSNSGLRSGRYSRRALQREDSDADDDDDESTTSTDTLTTPPHRRTKLAPSTPAYATAPTPPNVVYPLPSGVPPTPRSEVSRMSSTGRAAKVPLPPSSVGSPRSVYTRLSRKGGSIVGSAVGRA